MVEGNFEIDVLFKQVQVFKFWLQGLGDCRCISVCENLFNNLALSKKQQQKNMELLKMQDILTFLITSIQIIIAQNEISKKELHLTHFFEKCVHVLCRNFLLDLKKAFSVCLSINFCIFIFQNTSSSNKCSYNLHRVSSM